MENGTTSENITEYIHRPLGESVVAIGGSFRITEEKRMACDGQDVLYLLSIAHMDNACCGVWGCYYAIVKGFVRAWKHMQDQQGYAMTRVVPVDNPKEQEQIRNKIMSEEMVQQVIFS